jgi:hypothetical protein
MNRGNKNNFALLLSGIIMLISVGILSAVIFFNSKDYKQKLINTDLQQKNLMKQAAETELKLREEQKAAFDKEMEKSKTKKIKN